MSLNYAEQAAAAGSVRNRVAVLIVCAGCAMSADWPQFGGPNGNFAVDRVTIASSWPATGPKQLWKRPLGEGYSGVSVENDVLYTMYRRGEQEVVTALDAASGKTRWEFAYDAPGASLDLSNGPGPHSTPLVFGDRVYTIGIRANMYAFDKKTGKPVWRKELYRDFPGSTEFDRGYAVSPVLYRDTIIVKLGGRDHAIVALSPKDGSMIWRRHSFGNAPATPVILRMGSKDVLLTQFAGDVAAIDPASGDLLWNTPHKTDYGLNITPAMMSRSNVVVVTSAYSGGARGIQVAEDGTKPQELWKNNRLRVHFTTALMIGDYVYGSSGDFGPAPLTCVEAKTGRVVWQDRTFSKANLIRVADKVVLLDEDGTLALVTLTPEGLKVHSKVEQVALNNAWTAPSLGGTVLYVRDRRNLVAFDLK